MSDSDLLRLKRCQGCGNWWSLRPYACAVCGGTDLRWATASGSGIVRAKSTVTRAPDEFWRSQVPYTLVLVKLAEGPTVMGHAEAAVEIGQTVSGQPITIGGRQILKFTC